MWLELVHMVDVCLEKEEREGEKREEVERKRGGEGERSKGEGINKGQHHMWPSTSPTLSMSRVLPTSDW